MEKEQEISYPLEYRCGEQNKFNFPFLTINNTSRFENIPVFMVTLMIVCHYFSQICIKKFFVILQNVNCYISSWRDDLQ